jgi:hypothetical protein
VIKANLDKINLAPSVEPDPDDENGEGNDEQLNNEND